MIEVLDNMMIAINHKVDAHMTAVARLAEIGDVVSFDYHMNDGLEGTVVGWYAACEPSACGVVICLATGKETSIDCDGAPTLC